MPVKVPAFILTQTFVAVKLTVMFVRAPVIDTDGLAPTTRVPL